MNTRKMVLSALLMAIGIILPFITMQVPEIGNMLLPMHIPVLLCGFICGAPYGAIIGFILPLIRSLLFGAPVMMPTAFAMAIELMFYGMITGMLYRKLKNIKFGIYLTLVPSLLIGRIAWGIAAFILFSIIGTSFTWMIFIAGAFINAIPGIIIQMILIPIIVSSLKKIEMDVVLNEHKRISNNSRV
jgi:riboflavin transporter FmnP